MAYTPKWTGSEQAAEILKIAELVKVQYPADWKLAHTGQPGTDNFIQRVAWACRDLLNPDGALGVGTPARKGTVGNNWKRGQTGTYSGDVLALPNPSGCSDSARQFAGLELIDIIVGAGGPSPSISWNDVTQATIDGGVGGGWVAPHEIGGPVPVPQPPVDCAAKFPPQDQVFEFGKALNEKYRADRHAPLIGTDSEGIVMYVNLKGMSIWLGDYMRHRVAGMDHAAAQTAVFVTIDQVPL